MTAFPATIPSPSVGVIHLGPLPVRMYALCILVGIVVAIWLTGRRLVPRGGEPGQALDVAAYAVLFGIVGGRLYHVITTPDPYWGAGGSATFSQLAAQIATSRQFRNRREVEDAPAKAAVKNVARNSDRVGIRGEGE